MTLYFITGNTHKFAELLAMIPHVDVRQLDIDLPEIQSLDQQAVLETKLESARAQAPGKSLFVEDTGLYVDGMNGLPGTFTKFFLQALGAQGIAELVHARYELHAASAKTTIGYFDGSSSHFFEGIMNGHIVAPRGVSFGWDPIFEEETSGKTYGEMTREEKNAISQRGKAIAKLAAFLNSS